MSVTSEISRLQTAKADLKTAIEGKGVTVPSSATLDDYADLVDEIEQGGGEDEGVEKKDVNFYDIDGKRVYSYTLAEALALTDMPTPPDHSNDFVPLTSQGWNWTYEQLQSLTYPQAEIGAIYEPTDGLTHVVLEITKDIQKTITLSVGVTNGPQATIDWGDGTSSETEGHISPRNITHTYAALGKYDVKLWPTTSGNRGIYFGQTTGTIIPMFPNDFQGNIRECLCAIHFGGEAANHGSNIGYIMHNFIITLNKGQTISPQFQYTKLRGIILPSSVIQTNNIAYTYTELLSLPYNITIAHNSLSFNYCLRNFSIPPGVTLSGTVLRNGFYLNKIWIPEGITTLSNQAFQAMNALYEVHFPSTLTSIGNQAGEGWNKIYNGTLYIAATVPPTLGSYFQVSEWKIYVPYSEDHSILEAYKAATNWSAFAANMEEYNF